MKISNNISKISFLLYLLFESFFSPIGNNIFKYNNLDLLQNSDKYKTID